MRLRTCLSTLKVQADLPRHSLARGAVRKTLPWWLSTDLHECRAGKCAGTQLRERMDLDDSLIPNQHLVLPGSSELSYTSSLASAPERMMLLTTQGELLSLMGSLP